METVKDEYKTSRILYIIEAALEYFISIAVGTIYLAKLTAYVGMSDAVTGILTSFVSLGCGFQIIAVFLSRFKPVKRWVTPLHIISQIMFAFLYIVPLLEVPFAVKTAIFIILLLVAHVIHNIINPPKVNWFMSLVDDDKRGKFTASKEIVSLIGGMIVSYLLGFVMDYYTDKGEIKTAFIICGIGLFVIMTLHSLTLIFSKEKPTLPEQKQSKSHIKELFRDKNILKIVLIAAIWNVACYAVTPFMGTYQNNELGFTTSFASLIIIIASVARIIFSKPFGRFADKHGFAKMLCICLSIEVVAFTVAAFITPASGKVTYFIYYVIYCIGQAGVNSSFINIIYDYVDESKRTDALALNQTLYGIAGFLTTLALSPVLALIQKNGNRVFGINLYAQQLFAVIGAIITVLLIIYIVKVIFKLDKNNSSKENNNG